MQKKKNEDGGKKIEIESCVGDRISHGYESNEIVWKRVLLVTLNMMKEFNKWTTMSRGHSIKR